MGDGGRQDYNTSVRFRQIRPGEPWFLVLGRDVNAADVVRDWAVRAFQAGSPPALVESALQQADALDAYGDKKVPDADHLSDGQQKQLEYQFDRRAWRALPTAQSSQIMFAERRGFAQASARLARAQALVAQLHTAATEALTLLPAGETAAKLAALTAFTAGYVAGVAERREANGG